MNLDSRRWQLVLQFGVGLVFISMFWVVHALEPHVPTPDLIVNAFVVQLTEEELVGATVNALRAISIGFILAVIVGIPLGLAMGLNHLAEDIFDPYINGLYSTPLAALVPAFIIWFGTGFQVRIVVVFFFAIFPIVINTLEGAKMVPNDLMNAARSFGADRRFLIRDVVFPHEIPYVLAGLRMGIGRGVKGLVVTELLVSVTGFGSILHRWSSAFRMEGVFSVVIVLMLLGVVLTALLGVVRKRIVHWDVSKV